jgi:hypothetical protein
MLLFQVELLFHRERERERERERKRERMRERGAKKERPEREEGSMYFLPRSILDDACALLLLQLSSFVRSFVRPVIIRPTHVSLFVFTLVWCHYIGQTDRLTDRHMYCGRKERKMAHPTHPCCCRACVRMH